MESQMSHFRVKLSSNNKKPNNTSRFSSTTISAIPSEASAQRSSSACGRCRHLKKECSRTLLECTSCVSAGLTCSLRPSTMTENADLRKRLSWREALVKQGSLLAPGKSIEEVATGTQISDITTDETSPLPSLVSHHTASMDEIGTSGTSPLSRRRLSPMEPPYEPPVKRARLSPSLALRRANETIPQSIPPLPEPSIVRHLIDVYF
ncbi:Fc.00g036290.m01.CDS01 [Cosmosporella sp. VM-42]